MKQPKFSRRISSARLRALFNEIADELCSQQEKVTVNLTGNTFEIYLEEGSVNITINEKGGEQ